MVTDIWVVLVGFLTRLMAGMALFLLLVPASQTRADFFRLKAWIIMGLGTVAAVASSTHMSAFSHTALTSSTLVGLITAATAAAYFSSVAWLYQAASAGKWLLAFIVVVTLAAGWACAPAGQPWWLAAADTITASAVLGGTLTSMLLGHWYLNSPQMDLRPIQQLTAALGASLVARAIVAAISVWVWGAADVPAAFVVLRWFAGIILPAVLCGLVWGTLKVPNTQSATGILYAILILVFIGELVAQLSPVAAAG